MKNLVNLLNTLIIVTILGLCIWYFFFKDEDLPSSTITYNYITDTVILDTIFIPGKPFKVETPPKTIVYYETDSSAIKDLILTISNQNILISGLQDSILKISKAYLKQNPKNPKIISADLNLNEFRLGLLNTDGQIAENSWPIDLYRFEYRWDYNSSLSRHPVNPPPTNEKAFAEYYVGGGVDILRLSPYISGSIEKTFTRIRAYGELRFGLLNYETSSINLGIDYNLNGKGRIRED